MELELYALVYCVKQLSPYLLGREFQIKTDHKNLIYLSNSTIPKLVRWRVILSEFQFRIAHIPGTQNSVADALTRLNRQVYSVGPVESFAARIFRFEGEDTSPLGRVESDSEDDETLPTMRESDRFATFTKFHNSSVGHFGITKTLQAMAIAGHGWRGMRSDVTGWINECGICQKSQIPTRSSLARQYQSSFVSNEVIGIAIN